MTKAQKNKIKALNRLAGMLKVNGANRKKSVKGYRFVGKTT
jgi:hypothetical protein